MRNGRHRGQVSAIILASVVILALVGAATALALTLRPNQNPATRTTAGSYPSFNGLAETPPMGFNDWNRYHHKIDRQVFVDNAKALVSLGLAKLGYRYVNIDGGWEASNRKKDGTLPAARPHNMRSLGHYLHSEGLKFGIYTDAGYHTCAGAPGSYGHFRQDAHEFAEWGVDFVKMDYCSPPDDRYPGKTPAQVARIVFTKASKALRDSGRPMLFSESAPAYYYGPGSKPAPTFWQIMKWIGHEGNLWRVGVDIKDTWTSLLTNFDQDTTPSLAAYAGPGHWNDPDLLEIGNGGLSPTEEQSQFTLWSELAAPLLISTTVSKMTPEEVAILSNKDIIAVDQDRLGAQGTIVSSGPGYDVLTKPLNNGDRAVVLFNRTDAARAIRTTAGAVGPGQGRSYLLKDLVTKRKAETAKVIAATVPAHGTVIFRVSPVKSSIRAQPATPLSAAVPPLKSGSTMPVTVTLANNGPRSLHHVTLRMTAPTGGSVHASSATSFPAIQPGSSVTPTWDVTPRAVPPGKPIRLRIKANAIWLNRKRTTTSLTVSVPTPYASLNQAFNNVAVTNDSNPPVGDFAGLGDFNGAYWTYSAQALAAAGIHPGAVLHVGNLAFRWPSAPPGSQDNVKATGQTIDVSGRGKSLAFLGAASFGSATGTAIVHYTDGSSSQAALWFPGWGGPAGDPVIAAKTSHINTQFGDFPGAHVCPGYIYVDKLPLTAGKTVASVTLPDHDTLHVFAVTFEH